MVEALTKTDEDFKKIDRNLIKRNLKEKDVGRIAHKANCSKSLVYKVLDGKRTNVLVLSAAIDVAIENENEKQNIVAKSKQILTDA